MPWIAAVTAYYAAMDAIDLRILERLQHDARISNVELAKAVSLSPSPCLARVRALEAGASARLAARFAADFPRERFALSGCLMDALFVQAQASSACFEPAAGRQGWSSVSRTCTMPFRAVILASNDCACGSASCGGAWPAMTYSIDGVSVTKSIQRQVFANPKTQCES